jgi:hypothetical protein
MDEVWVITAHVGHGEDSYVMGVYASPEAARAALEKAPNMAVTEEDGQVLGRPADEQRYPREWAIVDKHQVKR